MWPVLQGAKGSPLCLCQPYKELKHKYHNYKRPGTWDTATLHCMLSIWAKGYTLIGLIYLNVQWKIRPPPIALLLLLQCSIHFSHTQTACTCFYIVLCCCFSSSCLKRQKTACVEKKKKRRRKEIDLAMFIHFVSHRSNGNSRLCSFVSGVFQPLISNMHVFEDGKTE